MSPRNVFNFSVVRHECSMGARKNKDNQTRNPEKTHDPLLRHQPNFGLRQLRFAIN